MCVSVFACQCLNVTLTSASAPRPVTEPHDQRPSVHSFPCSTIGILDDINICCEEPTLLERKESDSWIIYRCLACSTYTHATHMQTPELKLLNMDLATSPEKIASLRNSDSYSSVFNIMIMRTDDDTTTVIPQLPLSHTIIGNLNKRLTRTLQSKLETIEEEIRRFREQKCNELEEFKERAHQDYKYLTNILSQEFANSSDIDVVNHIKIYEAENSVSIDKSSFMKKHTPIRTNSVTFSKPPKSTNVAKNLVNASDYKEDSLDSEGIFDLEGMDSSTMPHIDHNSDAYDTDSDDSVSRDEGIHCTRMPNQPWKPSIAKSLPVNVPVFTHFHEHSKERLNDNHPEEPHDIAASIKALARSVHDDVFGDLPRPRFTTQI